MKALLVIVGIILIAGAVYGFINAGNGGEGVGVTVEGVGTLEITPDKDFLGDAASFATDNRIIIAIVGAVSLIAGLAIPSRRRA